MTSRGLLPHLRALTAVQGFAVRLGLAPTMAGAAQKSSAERQLVKPASWMSRRPSPGVSSHEVTITSRSGPLRVRLYQRPEAPADGPAVLYIHGGGFIFGGLDAAHWLCSELAQDTGMIVASVEYRLAPGDPHPAALEDCYDALTWLAASGVDAQRIAVAGDSAGGNLSAALTLLVRERGGPAIAHQTLIYPVLDTRIDSTSWTRWAGGGIDADAGRHMVELWVGTHPSDDPLVAPLLSPDLSGLPPAHVVVAECDVLHDDGVAYAARLLEDGVPARLTVSERLPHGFLSLNRLCPPARSAVRTIADEVVRGLRATPPAHSTQLPA